MIVRGLSTAYKFAQQAILLSENAVN